MWMFLIPTLSHSTSSSSTPTPALPSTMPSSPMDFPSPPPENPLFAPSNSFWWPNRAPCQHGWISRQRLVLCRSRGSLPDKRRWRRAGEDHSRGARNITMSIECWFLKGDFVCNLVVRFKRDLVRVEVERSLRVHDDSAIRRWRPLLPTTTSSTLERRRRRVSPAPMRFMKEKWNAIVLENFKILKMEKLN